jgi:hypothetical protein
LKPSLATLKILVSKCLSQYIFYQSLSNVLVKLWQEYEDFEAVTRKNETEAYDDAIENWQRALKELKKQLEEWHKERQEQLEKLLEDIEYLFLDKQSKAGTIEWPLRKYRTDSLNRKESKILKTAKHQFLEWKNTWKALLADWVLNLEVYDFWYETRYQMNDMRRIWLDKCDNSLKPVLDPLKQYIEEVNVKPSKDQKYSLVLKEQLLQARKQFEGKLMPAAIEKLAKQNLPGLFDKLDKGIQSALGQLSEEMEIGDAPKYDQMLDDRRIKRIYPRKIAYYGAYYPRKIAYYGAYIPYTKEFNGLKQALNGHILTISNDLSGIGPMLVFNLKTLIEGLESGEKTEEECSKILEEALERIREKVVDAFKQLDDISLLFDKEMETALDVLYMEVFKLTTVEEALVLKMKLVKAKVISQSDEIGKRGIGRITSIGRLFIWEFRKGLNTIKGWIDYIRQFTPYAKKEPRVTSEITNFLVDSQRHIQQLPYIYQHIYKPDPLKDYSLYKGRNQEEKVMQSAIESWGENRYMTIALIGEKGSGLTSALNYCDDVLLNTIKNHRINPSRKIWSERAFTDMFNEAIPELKAGSIDELKNALIAIPGRYAIMIDDIQHLFQKKIDGFTIINLLLDVMASLRKKVLWIITSNQHAWQYLKKTTTIEGYFEYVITPEALQPAKMSQILRARNQMSGYNIQFSAAGDDELEKKIDKLPQEKQQAALEEIYFSNLYDFCKSNISLSLFFWLRCAKKLDDYTIEIKPFPKRDLSFVSSLTAEMQFIIHALILHDGLDEESVARILDWPRKKCHLLLNMMLDDGLLTFMEGTDVYRVNLIIYRQLVELLKTKNFLH